MNLKSGYVKYNIAKFLRITLTSESHAIRLHRFFSDSLVVGQKPE